MRYETLLLDFHGTFTNSDLGRTAHALNQAYQKVMNRNISHAEYQEIMNRNNNHQNPPISVPTYLDIMINGHLSAKAKQLLIETYRQSNKYIYIPKHSYLIRELHALGSRVVILTNGIEKDVTEVLKTWGLNKYILDIYGKGAEGKLENKPRKPHPEVIDYVISDLRRKGHSINRSKTLMVGDYKHDIEAGNSAGIHTAFIIVGPNQKPEDYTFRPTYVLIDRPSLKPSSEWIKEENIYPMRQLPSLVSGKI